MHITRKTCKTRQLYHKIQNLSLFFSWTLSSIMEINIIEIASTIVNNLILRRRICLEIYYRYVWQYHEIHNHNSHSLLSKLNPQLLWKSIGWMIFPEKSLWTSSQDSRFEPSWTPSVFVSHGAIWWRALTLLRCILVRQPCPPPASLPLKTSDFPGPTPTWGLLMIMNWFINQP